MVWFKHIIHYIIFAVFSILLSSASVDLHAQDAAKGEALFKANCTSCHKVHKKLVGPALAGVHNKYEKEWLYKWIKNSQALIASGDETAKALFEEYNGSVMQAFPALSNEDIDGVLAYIAEETLNVPVASGPGAGGEQKGWDKSSIFIGFLAIILLFIVLILSRISSTLTNLIQEKMGFLIPEAPSFNQKFFNKKLLAAASLIIMILLISAMVNNAQRLGRQQGYAPTQPIKFSHKLHAGVNKIDCKYCHSGAVKGKSAVIPSVNVCMNCHKAINEGPTYGTAEISKIYKAAGWDPDKQVYTGETKPIEWIRIHNLPDHVYFNHAQHVNAGGLECQQCHGQVEDMEVLQQHASLGMGWCINCHRETEVQFESNDYYKSYEKYHDQLKKGEIKQVTVEDIGGLECQKCHY